MFCMKCGAKMYDDNAEFCSVCGAPMKQNKDRISYETQTEKINRVLGEIKEEKSVNELFNNFMSEPKNKPYRDKYSYAKNNNSYNDNQENEEWLNEEAIKEIWNVPQNVNEPEPNEDLLPDGTPEWLDEIKQEEEYEEYKSKFHITEHPLILTSIVALFMVIFSIISIIVIWNV